MRITAVIADDEPLARRRLASLIADIPWAVQIGEAHDGADAVEAAERLRPDVLFLDIQMPALSGIEVVRRLRRLESPPRVIFTTAHDHYAVAAFELEAVDYLLKPFGARRFLTALERARDLHVRDTPQRWIARRRSSGGPSPTPRSIASSRVKATPSFLCP